MSLELVKEIVVEDKGTVEVLQLHYCDEAVNFITGFFYDNTIFNSLCDDDRKPSFIFNFIESFKTGKILCLLPRVGSETVGMFYGYFMNHSVFEVHQGMFSATRKGNSVLSARACADKAFEITNAHSMMGFVPKSNKPSTYCAQMSGFKIQGEIKNYFTINGKKEDVHILVRERI